MNSITHAVIPAAGFGTRFLPFTKTVPKELVPLLARPAIEYILQESLSADIKNICIIANKNKQALYDYFKKNVALEEFLAHKNQLHLLQKSNDLLNQLHIEFVEQPEPKGLGHAVSCAQSIVQNNSFCVILPDDLMIDISGSSLLKNMIRYSQQYNAIVIAVEEVPLERVSSYGIVRMADQIDQNLFKIDAIIEKPRPEQAPSRYAVIGRYVLLPAIFDALKNIKPGSGGEIQLTDGIAACIHSGVPVMAYVSSARRFDLGNPHGWLQANIFLARQNSEYSKVLKIIDN